MKPFACTTASAPLNPSLPPPSGFVNAGAGAVRAGVVVGAEAPPLVVVCAGAVLAGGVVVVVAVPVVLVAGCVLVVDVCAGAGALAAVTVLVPPPHPLSSISSPTVSAAGESGIAEGA